MRLNGVFTLLVFGGGLLSAQNMISNLAGGAFCASSPAGDGGPAISATLCSAANPVTDPRGNIYFADSHRIRKIDLNGIITTIAGNGVFGSAGDGGPALAANLGSVNQLAVDPSGQHLCFADSYALKIRCLTFSTGILQGYGTGTSTFGGAGDGGNIANASFADPAGMAFDSSGNSYISDFSDNRVRQVNATTGIITTFAGPGPGYCCAPLGDGGPALGADLYEPGALYYSNGGLYIADRGNFRVRRVDLASGIITTVAGNGNPSDSGSAGSADGGPATLAGIVPGAIALDGSGNLFIATAQVIRKVDTSGIISTVAGEYGVSGFGADDLPATQTVFGGISGLGWDSRATRLLIPDAGARLRQIFFTPPTTTTLVPSANPAVPGAQVTFQATVSPATATGAVRFYQDITLLGSVALTNGAASIAWTAPLGGQQSYGMRAVYGGDLNDNLSASPTVSETVQQGSTTTALSSSPNPSAPGQAVTFTATVHPAAAAGTVNLVNAATSQVIGSGTLSGGVAVFTISNFTPGTVSVYAWYTGSSSYLSSISSTITQVVKSATTTAIGSSLNPSTFGSAVTLTATVTPSSATGAVQFFNGTTLLGSANVAGGAAQITLTSLPAGSDSLTAVYGGDATDSGSTSAALIQTVKKVNSTAKLAANPPSQANQGQTVTFTATISPASATGVVQFLDGNTLLGAATLTNGTAAFATSSLANGSHTIFASYPGDNNVNASKTAPLSYKIKR